LQVLQLQQLQHCSLIKTVAEKVNRFENCLPQ